ncbi:MAG: ferrochelatase [Chitinophagaceae bacterium]
MKRGIVLMNLGSPDSTEVKDVKKYLMQFLMDSRVIDYPYIFRAILVGGIIVPTRAARSAEAYKRVWTDQGSPLVETTRQVRNALQEELSDPVEMAMRYGNPSVEAAFNSLMKNNPDLEEVLAIPMYPHYAMSSYETAVEYAKEIHEKKKFPFRLDFVKPFYNNPEYLEAMKAVIGPYIQKNNYDHILFSFHGIPERHITKGDITHSHCLKTDDCCFTPSSAHLCCYRHQCLNTAKSIADQLGIPPAKYSHSFQSRLGREQWLTPYTDFRLRDFPGEGVKKLLILCPAFVSDCLETLEEIAMEGRETFMHAGGEEFTMIPCMNTNPVWISALAKWSKDYAQGNTEMVLS